MHHEWQQPVASPELKYLGTWIASTIQIMHVGKGQAWKAMINSLQKICKPNLSRHVKVDVFQALVDPGLFVCIRNTDFNHVTGEKFVWLLYHGFKICMATS